MQIPLVAGRELGPGDTAESEKVMLINEKMARRLWPEQNPIGKIAEVNGDRRVVGVVRNVRHQALEDEGGLEMYLPIAQASNGSVELVVRTKLPPSSLRPVCAPPCGVSSPACRPPSTRNWANSWSGPYHHAAS